MDNESEIKGKSGQQIGAGYAETLALYLVDLKVENRGLPSRRGKISMAAIALASGVDKQSLYKNRHCREMLEQAAQELGLETIATHVNIENKDGLKDQRIMLLEQQVATLQAENHGLRQRLKKFEYIDMHMVETGKRVIP